MTTEEKALALLNEVLAERVHWQMTGTRADNASIEALCRAIEQHEAFRQEVSDAMKEYCKGHGIPNYDRFIIHEPKPDPLVEVLHGEDWQSVFEDEVSDKFRATLDKFGLEIREKNDG